MRKGLSYSEAGKLGAIKSSIIQKKEKEKRIESYNQHPCKCKNCNRSLSYEKRNNKFCNHSCAASFNNLGIRRNFTTGKEVIKQCLNCQKITINPKYCSKKCQMNYQRQLRREKIEKEQKLFTRRDKQFLIEVRGNKCEICGIEKWQNKELIMILDHKNGNSDDNSLLNLRLICPNCDSQTLTYKNRNKGNGRYYRRKRYAEGKSY